MKGFVACWRKYYKTQSKKISVIKSKKEMIDNLLTLIKMTVLDELQLKN